jgi:hypothetical protein
MIRWVSSSTHRGVTLSCFVTAFGFRASRDVRRKQQAHLRRRPRFSAWFNELLFWQKLLDFFWNDGVVAEMAFF